MFDEIAEEKKVCIKRKIYNYSTISSNINRYFNNTFHESKVLKKVIISLRFFGLLFSSLILTTDE